MPHEVYPVQINKIKFELESDQIEKTSKDIKRVYNQVEEVGGEIVGAHTITPTRVQGSAEKVIYLVARFPDKAS